MMVDLDDVIAVLKELKENKENQALIPNENPYLQYARLGEPHGIKAAMKKIENHFGREG